MCPAMPQNTSALPKLDHLLLSSGRLRVLRASTGKFALTFNRKNELNPLPTGLYQFFGRNEVIWNELMAASLIGILPVMILYLVLQRYIIAGLTAGAIKQ
jgi:hypothetical protein